MKLLTTLALALAVLLGALGLPLPGGEEAPESPAIATAAPTATVSLSPLPARSIAPGTDFGDMEYIHYDPTLYCDQVDALCTLGQGNDAQTLCALYDRLYEEFLYIDTLCTLAYIRYSADVTDAYWSGEVLYCDELWSRTGDALSAACRTVLEGPLGADFAAHLGPEAAAVLGEYQAMTPRQQELTAREAELVDRYHTAMATAPQEAVYVYQGETWTFDKLDSYAGDALYAQDYEGYWAVSNALDQAVNQVVGPLFLELVDIRRELATLAGYDSYADYAYEETFHRDYTTADAQTLCQAVKAFSGKYYETLYYSELWYAAGTVAPVPEGEALLDVLGRYLPRFGPALESAFRYMTDHGLYTLSRDPNALPGGYTTSLSLYRSPYLYISLSGTCYDLSTLTHELGHFAEAWYNPTPHLLASAGSYDLFEVHSTGLEILFTEVYGEIYGDTADTARFITLGGLVEVVLEGCIYDEFQRRLYESPALTLEEVNRLYTGLLREYGFPTDQEVSYAWMYVSHNFDAPLYYLSYAVSALAALQLWDLSQTDFPAALAAYEAILAQGAWEESYLAVLESAGLRLFTEENAPADICRPAIACMTALEKAYATAG